MKMDKGQYHGHKNYDIIFLFGIIRGTLFPDQGHPD